MRFLIDRPQQLTVVNGLLFLTFLTRTVYEVGVLEEMWYLPDMPLTNDRDLGFESALCFIGWDYVPIFLLVTTVTTATGGSFAARTGSFIRKLSNVRGAGGGALGMSGDLSLHTMPNHGVWNEIKKGEQIRLTHQQHHGSAGSSSYSAARAGGTDYWHAVVRSDQSPGDGGGSKEPLGTGGNGSGAPSSRYIKGLGNNLHMSSDRMMRSAEGGGGGGGGEGEGGEGWGLSTERVLGGSGGMRGVHGCSWGGFGMSPLSPRLLGGHGEGRSLESTHSPSGHARRGSGWRARAACVVGSNDYSFLPSSRWVCVSCLLPSHQGVGWLVAYLLLCLFFVSFTLHVKFRFAEWRVRHRAVCCGEEGFKRVFRTDRSLYPFLHSYPVSSRLPLLAPLLCVRTPFSACGHRCGSMERVPLRGSKYGLVYTTIDQYLPLSTSYGNNCSSADGALYSVRHQPGNSGGAPCMARATSSPSFLIYSSQQQHQQRSGDLPSSAATVAAAAAHRHRHPLNKSQSVQCPPTVTTAAQHQ